MLGSQDEHATQLWYDNATDLVWTDLTGETNQTDAKKICHDLNANFYKIPTVEWDLPTALEFSQARRYGIAEAISQFNQKNNWTSPLLEFTRGAGSYHSNPKRGHLQDDHDQTISSITVFVYFAQ